MTCDVCGGAGRRLCMSLAKATGRGFAWIDCNVCHGTGIWPLVNTIFGPEEIGPGTRRRKTEEKQK